jgi:hypothetical protein
VDDVRAELSQAKELVRPALLEALGATESCAKLCDAFAATVTGMTDYERGMRAGAAACAEKIRGRSAT